MNIWAGIKLALNSTIGTSKFKPLDTILYETVTMKASDEVFLSTSYGENIRIDDDNNGAAFYLPQKFRASKYGQMKISTSHELVQMKSFTFTIYKNGEVYKTFDNSGLTTTIVNFEPYDEFMFGLTGKYNTAYSFGTIKNPTVNICGTIVPNVINSISD